MCIRHFLAGNSHSRLLHPGGPEALWVPERSQKVASLAAKLLFAKFSLFISNVALIQVRQHLLAGVQHRWPLSVGLQQHGNSAHLQTGDPEGEIRVSGSSDRDWDCAPYLEPSLVTVVFLAGLRMSPPHGEATWARCWWLLQHTCLPRSRKCSPRAEPSPPSDCPSAATRTSAP